ncbi:unnamed protein product, partial [Mesorhabditis spiculigera]
MGDPAEFDATTNEIEAAITDDEVARLLHLLGYVRMGNAYYSEARKVATDDFVIYPVLKVTNKGDALFINTKTVCVSQQTVAEQLTDGSSNAVTLEKMLVASSVNFDEYTCFGLDPTRHVTDTFVTERGTTTTYSDFYQRHYNQKATDPMLLCRNVDGDEVWLPANLCLFHYPKLNRDVMCSDYDKLDESFRFSRTIHSKLRALQQLALELRQLFEYVTFSALSIKPVLKVQHGFILEKPKLTLQPVGEDGGVKNLGSCLVLVPKVENQSQVARALNEKFTNYAAEMQAFFEGWHFVSYEMQQLDAMMTAGIAKYTPKLLIAIVTEDYTDKEEAIMHKVASHHQQVLCQNVPVAALEDSTQERRELLPNIVCETVAKYGMLPARFEKPMAEKVMFIGCTIGGPEKRDVALVSSLDDTLGTWFSRYLCAYDTDRLTKIIRLLFRVYFDNHKKFPRKVVFYLHGNYDEEVGSAMADILKTFFDEMCPLIRARGFDVVAPDQVVLGVARSERIYFQCDVNINYPRAGSCLYSRYKTVDVTPYDGRNEYPETCEYKRLSGAVDQQVYSHWAYYLTILGAHNSREPSVFPAPVHLALRLRKHMRWSDADDKTEPGTDGLFYL